MKKFKGFTLAELTVVMIVFSLVFLASVTVLTNSSQNVVLNETEIYNSREMGDGITDLLQSQLGYAKSIRICTQSQRDYLGEEIRSSYDRYICFSGGKLYTVYRDEGVTQDLGNTEAYSFMDISVTAEKVTDTKLRFNVIIKDTTRDNKVVYDRSESVNIYNANVPDVGVFVMESDTISSSDEGLYIFLGDKEDEE